MQALHSDDDYAHYGMGLLLSDQQNYQGALDEFQKAASSSSEISGLYFEMGNAYANLKRYDEAISSYSKEKEKTGDDSDIENALADAYQAKGMTQQARDARARAAQLKSGH
jgi:tetratricopeptide (TPR) repeat protein